MSPEPHPAALRGVESRRGDGDALARHVLEKRQQRGVGVDAIGLGQQFVPARVGDERTLHVEVANLVAPLVVVQQPVESDRRAGEDQLAHADVGLNGSGRPQTHQRELPLLGLLLPGLEVDVGQRVELRYGDVDVADADAGREHRHAPALVGAGNGVEFAVGRLALDMVEMFGHEGHAARVADQNDDVGQLLRTQMQVEDRPVVVDNQFGRRNGSHNGEFFISIIGIKVIYLPRITKRSERFS